MIKRLFGNWREVPSSWREAMYDAVALNLPNLPITQFIGYERFVANRDSTFPSNPVDGQPFILSVDSANGVNWALRYDNSISDSYKWTFEGGAPLSHTVNTEQTTASTGYTDLATTGPTVTIPKAGVYKIEFGGCASNSTADSDTKIAVNYGGSSPLDAEAIEMEGIISSGGSENRVAQSRTIIATATAAGTVKLQYRVTSGTGRFRNRWIIVTPVRLAS